MSPPKFEFVKDEDLQASRAERDTKLYALGWRPKKSYIMREYEIPEEDFDLADSAAPETQSGFSKHGASYPCGCGKNKTQSFFKKLFASKSEKQHAKDLALMNEFAALMSEDGQDAG